MLDLIINGGLVIDGTGATGWEADVGIRGDGISQLGDLSGAEAKERIDASGCVVCPGFIDVHSHSDTYLLIEPSAPSKIFQGITTEVVGNCGASAAPLLGDYRMPSDWADKEYPGSWSSVAEYRALLEQQRPAPNVVLLIGHNTLRAGIAGYADRRLSSDELRQMMFTLDQALDEGGRGMSSGLLYPPGMYAPAQEILMLAKVVASRDGIYTSHMRSESAELLDAVRETIDVGRESGCRVEVSHLKATGRGNWDLAGQAIEIIEDARAEGVRVAADRYPYTYSSTDLDVIFPPWAEEGGRDAVLGRLRDAGQRKKIREALLEGRFGSDWESITIGSTGNPDNRRFQGIALSEVADMLQMEPVDAVLHILDTDDLKTSAFFAGMSDENMIRILSRPWVMVGSDASLRSLTGPLSRDYPHPRAYGSFPRFFRLMLDSGLLPVEEIIRKTTSLPAGQFGLKGRGTISEGSAADLVVFDPEVFRDTATCSNPHQLATGMKHVVINGEFVLRNGALTGKRAGRFL